MDYWWFYLKGPTGSGIVNHTSLHPLHGCKLTLWLHRIKTMFLLLTLNNSLDPKIHFRIKFNRFPTIRWSIKKLFDVSTKCLINLRLSPTSVLRPRSEVKMPRMKFRLTSRASSASWHEYCSRSFRMLTASWTVWTGAWDWNTSHQVLHHVRLQAFCRVVFPSVFAQ